MSSRPTYDHFINMQAERGPLGPAFARQALTSCEPWLPKPIDELDVLDIGSGYGETALAFAAQARSVLAIEPSRDLHEAATKLASGVANLSFENMGIEQLASTESFDLIILDNVYEHLPDQAFALGAISRALRPNGVLYLLVPNKLWPIEVHYRLPFLGYLPLPAANRYLRLSGRGDDYTDASHAPTYWGLSRALNARSELTWRYVLPGDPTATMAGMPLHYRAGLALLRRFPHLWAVSKALLVVAVKEARALTTT